MSVIRRSALAAATLSLSALFAAPLVSAQDPAPGLGDLQGLADSTASRALTARGYVRQSESGDYGRWWNGGDRRGGAGRRGAGGGEDAFGEALVDIGLGRDVGHVDRRGRGGVRDGGTPLPVPLPGSGVCAGTAPARHASAANSRTCMKRRAGRMGRSVAARRMSACYPGRGRRRRDPVSAW